jgi:glycine/D-amino acid oxidase-like deaminating enzyme/nitrite reductase/ring-hydroxylating ferredoxin subunit
MHQSTPADTSGARTLWQLEPRGELAGSRRFSPSEAHADVCVIGAGIAGLTTALLCAERGLRVVVLEGDRIGSGETLRTSAHLASALDERFMTLEDRVGHEASELLGRSHAAAIDFIEEFCKKRAPHAHFRRVPGYLYSDPADESAAGTLVEECRAAHRAGLDASIVEVPRFGVGPVQFAIRFENQAEFDPGSYLSALAASFVETGGYLWEDARVVGIDEGPTHQRVRLQNGHEVLARDVVVATNAPITEALSLPLKQAAYRSYVLAFEVPADWMEPSLHWDMMQPYHYVRLVRPRGGTSPNGVLLIGGEDHRTGQDDPTTRLAALEEWARDNFRLLGRRLRAWSGQIMEPFDGVGLVGKNPGSEHVYVITGDSGHGLTLGTLGAHIVRDQLLGIENPYTDLYDPSRRVTTALGSFLGQNADTVSSYLDHVRPADVESLDELEPGEGGLMREKGRTLAVCRDRAGQCHVHSAVCPHMGALVHFNAVEQSWDCPCHGSRFDLDGRVIVGPAIEGLAPAASPESVRRRAS